MARADRHNQQTRPDSSPSFPPAKTIKPSMKPGQPTLILTPFPRFHTHTQEFGNGHLMDNGL
jgi:hypothetical protein